MEQEDDQAFDVENIQTGQKIVEQNTYSAKEGEASV